MNKKTKTLLFTFLFSMIFCFSAFAGWEKENTKWKYLNDEGTYLSSSWEWIDGNQDGIAECYYFEESGYLATNKHVGEYQVDHDGKWVSDGQIQMKELSALSGWNRINGIESYYQDGVILRDCITPDNVYVNSNGYKAESGIDSELMAQKSAGCRYIAIKKSTHTLELWENGALKNRFVVNTGAAAGDKEVEGDWKTPEGEFYVCKKIPNSNFHLALGVSYPSIEDAERGIQNGLISGNQYNQIVTANQTGGAPDWHTALGGYIEIHGDRKMNPTRGCISLRNEDIDLLYSLTTVGDRIIIYS